MHDLEPLTPLGASEPRSDRYGPVTLTEVTDVALASVAARLGSETETRDTLSAILGSPAPAPSRHGGGTVSAFWTGPDQWMVEAPIGSHEDLARQLTDRLRKAASVTEQTDAWCRFDLKGTGLHDVLERLCPIDTRNWRGGEVQRTTLDHLGCFVLRREDAVFSVIGPRSSAGSLHHALAVACQSAL